MKVVKYGGSLFVKVPKGTDLKVGDEVILSKEVIQKEIKEQINNYNKDIEDQIEFRELLKQYLQGEQTAREQITEAINRLNNIEDKLNIKDNYRNEKVDLQKFYEDMMLLKNTFFKFKKEMGK